MKLTGKIIFIISLTVTTIITLIFYILILRFENQMEINLLFTARSVYKNILTVRQWVSKYNGVFVIKDPANKSNPYLDNPERITFDGDTLSLKNPALVTRELSELSNIIGGDFSFHMASRNYINPINEPDEFEESALLFFKDTTKTSITKEFYKIEEVNNNSYFRYFAPLFTKESCLHCHSQHGYKKGDLRGGISVLLSTDRYQKAKRDNLVFFLESAILSIIFLSILIFISLKRIVIKPLKHIEIGAKELQYGNYDFPLNLHQKDEIGSLTTAFNEMREKIQSYTNRLKISEKKYKNIIEHSLEAVAIIKSNGQIIESNSNFGHLSGYGQEMLKSQNFFHLIEPEPRKKNSIKLDSEINAEHFESVLKSQDELEIPVEIYITRGFSVGLESDLSFVYVRDLTERKKIEQYSIQTEKMFALGQISSGIAHEISNPLFALSNNMDYLNRKFKGTNEFDEIYPELRNGIDRIHHIVSAVLDFAKSHQPEFKKIELDKVIENSLVLVQKQFQKSDISIQTDYRSEYTIVEVDTHQFEQVFINLFLNAFHAMEGKGQLIIKTRCNRKNVEVQIQDNGKGIPEKDLGRVFDPFYTKFQNGTGLGLAIVRRILDQHNCTCTITSKESIGTTVKISIPFKQEM